MNIEGHGEIDRECHLFVGQSWWNKIKAWVVGNTGDGVNLRFT